MCTHSTLLQSTTGIRSSCITFVQSPIGKAGQNNGVLLLISKGERRVEIETCYGVEGILPDARTGNIEITPRFKQGDFDGGTLAGTKALVVALKADALQTNPRADQPSLDAC